MRTELVLVLLALASGVHGASHVQCQDGAAVMNPKIGKQERRLCTVLCVQDPMPWRHCCSVWCDKSVPRLQQRRAELASVSSDRFYDDGRNVLRDGHGCDKRRRVLHTEHMQG
jgi:hypothetical protein